MTLSSGTRLGPYEILSPLGAGGMGEVYRARDERLKRDVAIKVLPVSFSADPDLLRRFEQEAEAAGALNHPNITIVYAIGTHENAPYIVQELLEGETLRAVLASGRPQRRRAIDFAIQIAQGLAAAHEKGIVHRDLKPENVFVTKDGRVKILDFGIAKLIQPEIPPAQRSLAPTASAGTEPGVLMGTAAYMSPEQIRGERVDHRSDIFSFGAVLYETLAGRRAFQGGSVVETMSAILKEDPPDLSESGGNLPPGLERLVRHCLEKSPAQRFQSARDLGYDLENLSDVSSAGATRDLPHPISRPSLFRRATAVLAIAMALAVAVWSGRSFRRSQPLSYHQLTFQRGYVSSARFTPDGRMVVYSAAWLDKPLGLFSLVPESPESRPLGFPSGSLLAISRSGELALNLNVPLVSSPPPAGTLARVPLSGGSPREVLDGTTYTDWSPDGRLAIVRKVGGKSRLELPPGRVLYETAGRIGEVRVSRRGDRVAFIEHPFTNDVAGTIMQVGLDGTASPLTSEWLVTEGLAWSPRGNEVWFSASDTGLRTSLRAVTLEGKTRLLETAPTALKLQDVSAAGRILLTSENWKASLVGVPPGETVERELAWLDFSWPIDLSPDGKTLLFEEWGEANTGIYVRHLDGSAPVRLGDGLGLGLSPDGHWVLAMLYTSPPRLVLLPTGPGELKPVRIGDLFVNQWGRFLPDGKRIAFLAYERGRGNRIYVLDLSEEKPHPVTPEGVYCELSWGAVSPDGELIVGHDPDGKVTAYPVNGGSPRPILGAVPGDRPARWTADGRQLFVTRNEGSASKIFTIDASSGKRELWKELRLSDPVLGSTDHSLVLSGDGRSYFWARMHLLSELFLLEGVK